MAYMTMMMIWLNIRAMHYNENLVEWMTFLKQMSVRLNNTKQKIPLFSLCPALWRACKKNTKTKRYQKEVCWVRVCDWDCVYVLLLLSNKTWTFVCVCVYSFSHIQILCTSLGNFSSRSNWQFSFAIVLYRVEECNAKNISAIVDSFEHKVFFYYYNTFFLSRSLSVMILIYIVAVVDLLWNRVEQLKSTRRMVNGMHAYVVFSSYVRCRDVNTC